MQMLDGVNQHLKISANTITVLSDEGKTAGMIRNLETYYNISRMNERMDLEVTAKKLMGKEAIYCKRFLSRLFKSGTEWFYLIDDKENDKIQEWLGFCPQGVNPKDIAFMNTQEEAALAFGATSIHAASLHDGRGI